jgi:hypothetical protein
MLQVLAQMDHSLIQGTGTPELSVEHSFAMPWIIAAVLIAGILLVTFKTSKRNFLDKE